MRVVSKICLAIALMLAIVYAYGMIFDETQFIQIGYLGSMINTIFWGICMLIV